jgi:hypothetical protein
VKKQEEAAKEPPRNGIFGHKNQKKHRKIGRKDGTVAYENWETHEKMRDKTK